MPGWIYVSFQCTTLVFHMVRKIYPRDKDHREVSHIVGVDIFIPVHVGFKGKQIQLQMW